MNQFMLVKRNISISLYIFSKVVNKNRLLKTQILMRNIKISFPHGQYISRINRIRKLTLTFVVHFPALPLHPWQKENETSSSEALDMTFPAIGVWSLPQMRKAIMKYFCIYVQVGFQTRKFMRDFSHLEAHVYPKDMTMEVSNWL